MLLEDKKRLKDHDYSFRLRMIGDLALERMTIGRPEQDIDEMVQAIDRGIALQASSKTRDAR